MTEQQTTMTSTNDWPLGKIIKHVLLPKPKGSPKAGWKEYTTRGVFFSLFLSVALYFNLQAHSLPSCSGVETGHLVEKIINDMPLVKDSGAKFVTLKKIEEQGHNKESELRSCAAILVTTAGEDSLQYSIKWNDDSKKMFYVEARLQ